MAKGFFIKMAAGNLSRSRRMYVPYFISAVIMISIYFMAIMIMYMRSIGNIDYSNTVQQMFTLGVIVMTILIFPFMLYINSFLIKRRKKEFGLYGILGLEKRHVMRVILWENLMVSLSALILGIVTGCVFGRLVFMLLLFALRAVASGSSFTIPWQSFAYTAALFTAIFFVTSIYNILHVRLASPIDLLKGGQKGERKVRFIIPFTAAGLILLCWAYYTSLTVSNALAALNKFFIAVIAVVVATYLLFITGSVFLLNILRKNKPLYYKANNFVAISGMFHRMKQNAAGLATICILATMVLVTVSSCCALFLGQEDILSIMYPDDISISVDQNITADQMAELDALIYSLEKKYQVSEKNRYSYSYLRDMILYKDKEFSVPAFDENFTYRTYEDELCDLSFIPLKSYNDNCGDNETISDNEVLVLANDDLGGLTAIHAGNTDYKVKRIVTETKFTIGHNSIPSIYIVAKDADAAQKIRTELNPDAKPAPLYNVIVFDVDGNRDSCLSFAKELRSRGLQLDAVTSVKDIFSNRISGYGIYGGLLFLGLFFTVLFLTATVLIIYFKQVSEGYDDKDRFEILQKVGMDDDEVKRTINKQILIVFFLPLAGALLHLMAASHMIVKMLEVFSLYNRALSFLCILATCIIFGISYAIVYRLTAKTYYRIVKR